VSVCAGLLLCLVDPAAAAVLIVLALRCYVCIVKSLAICLFVLYFMFDRHGTLLHMCPQVVQVGKCIMWQTSSSSATTHDIGSYTIHRHVL
jgi:hypothetical protein